MTTPVEAVEAARGIYRFARQRMKSTVAAWRGLVWLDSIE